MSFAELSFGLASPAQVQETFTFGSVGGGPCHLQGHFDPDVFNFGTVKPGLTVEIHCGEIVLVNRYQDFFTLPKLRIKCGNTQ